MNKKADFITSFLPPVLLFLFFILLWHVIVTLLSLPTYLFPTPLEVTKAITKNSQQLLQALSLTASAAFCGFCLSLVIGTLSAFLFSQSKIIEKSFYPYAIFLQTVPIVAIAPLIIIWFGTGFQSVVIVAFIISLFPIITNTTTGLTRISQNHLDLFQLYNASRWQTLFKLKFPNAIPHLMTGAKISSGLSVIGAIVGEFFAGYGTDLYGLGYVIILASGHLKTPYLFAAIFASTLLGIVFFMLINFVSDVLLARWQKTEI